MEWTERLNDVMGYIEDNLENEINFAKCAEIACCSEYHFQRMFGYIAGVTLGEYIRRRKMTRAAADLQNGEKVLDTAIKYGYDSPTSFNRAFQATHGVAPSKAAGAVLVSYPPLSFKMIIKGVEEMNYRIEKKEAFRVVGYRIAVPTVEIENVEEVMDVIAPFFEATVKKFPEISAMADGGKKGVMGISTCDEEQNYYYLAAATGKAASDEMYELTVPETTWAIFPGSGSKNNILELQQRIVAEWLPTSGYEWFQAPDIEVYLGNDPENTDFEVWLPVVKK
jgi:AraC family transcriptional regulator